jgi:hypothetical protein
MFDYIVPKTMHLSFYALHQMTAKLVNGEKVLFTDYGDHLVLRTDVVLNFEILPTKSFLLNDVLVFELRASVGTKVKGKHRYFHTSDWRSRHDWLTQKASENGFELLSVSCSAEIAEVQKGPQKFTIDKTDFSGGLKIIDIEKFKTAIYFGIGNKAKAYGFGMLNI